MKAGAKRLVIEEKGAAMVLAVILLVVGGLILTPLLGLMTTGLATGQVYEERMYGLYAADAGVEHALSLLKYVGLIPRFPDYDEYDYFTKWSYDLDDDEKGVGELVNDKSVHVTIENVWMPSGIDAPDPITARQIIEEASLIIAGSPSVSEASTYEIKLTYDTGCEGPGAAQVETLGVWLPPGFEYDDNCSLEGEDYYSEPAVTTGKAGCVVVWSFGSPVTLSVFPECVTFQYSGPEGQTPGPAVCWIDTSEGYTWDADIKVYKITSTATDPDTGKQCTVEGYSTKTEPRKMGATISGDYHAIGATMMTATATTGEDRKYRNRLFKESSAILAEGDIPSSAIIEAAYLYWSGWIEEPGEPTIVLQDNCSDFNAPPMAWTHGNAWDTYNGRFRGTAYNKGATPGRYLTMSSSIDLSAYTGQTVEVSWQQDEDGDLEDQDRLCYAFSADGGSTWSADYEAFRNDDPPSSFSDTIPNEYLTDNFRMRFYLDGFKERDCWWIWCWTEYCYIDNIAISASGESFVENARVNRVMFGTTGNMTQVTADQGQIAFTPDAGEQWGSTGGENSWSYSCFYDATNIVRAQLDPDTRSGTFTLGHVLEGDSYQLYPDGETDYPLATPAEKQGGSYPTQYQWTYAGWSLLIIYSSPETKGHQLYLFDEFRYVGLDTLLTFPISGFLTPDDTTGSHLTYFVGEGDNHYDNDYIKVNGYQLPLPGDPYEDPPVNPQNNVFNSYSNSLDDPYLSGVDIDTFDMSLCMDPGDGSAEVILDNGEEIYDLVYIILSFRTETTGGGIMSYLIRG